VNLDSINILSKTSFIPAYQDLVKYNVHQCNHAEQRSYQQIISNHKQVADSVRLIGINFTFPLVCYKNKQVDLRQTYAIMNIVFTFTIRKRNFVVNLLI